MSLVAAIAERLIPGAQAAGVHVYMEREAPAEALAALEAQRFLELDGEAQDALLGRLERERPGLFEPLLASAREGMFGDPSYGGNVDRVGWALLGYPGPRAVITATDQELA